MYLTNDATGEVGAFRMPRSGWSDSTEGEIDAYLLAEARTDKLKTLSADRVNFCMTGYVYGGNTFCISDESKVNITFKNTLPAGATDRYKYYDASDVQVNFADADGWNAFYDAISPEMDRIMRYYCAKKKEINDAETVAAVDAITIDFTA